MDTNEKLHNIFDRTTHNLDFSAKLEMPVMALNQNFPPPSRAKQKARGKLNLPVNGTFAAELAHFVSQPAPFDNLHFQLQETTEPANKLAIDIESSPEIAPATPPEMKYYLMQRGAGTPMLYKAAAAAQATPTKQHSWRYQVLRALLAIVVLAAAGFYGYLKLLPPTEDATANPAQNGAAAVAAVNDTAPLESDVIAKAFVKPIRSATLAVAVEGPIVKIVTQEGQSVRSGATLLQVDSALQTVDVAQARINLKQAQIDLQETEAGSRPQELEAAQASVDSAQARLANAQQSVTPEAIAAAKSALTAAQAKLQQLSQGAEEATLIQARTNLRNAEVVVQRARSVYNQVSWRADIGMLPESLELQTATNNYEAALASFNVSAQPASSAAISAAQAEIENARANLARLQATNQQAAIDVSAADVRRAEADLSLLNAGARPETIARSEAAVQAAEIALLRAQTILSQTVLQAPFAGIVGELAIEIGEHVAPGQAVVQLGDISAWRIETSDLTELDITRVREGAPVTIAIDALPGEVLTGKVIHVKRLGENKVGDIVYTVEIAPDHFDERLRWNMTASVRIQAGE